MEKQSYAVADELLSEDIKCIRKRLNITQLEFANLVNISYKTVERWESSNKPITGPIVTLVGVLHENPQIEKHLRIPPKMKQMRLWYMRKNQVMTLIDVDERKREVSIHNFTEELQSRAFGKLEEPTFEQYEEFLESRCFPKSRDKMKLILRDLDLPFYDPLLIIEKTQGKMSEDDFWIRIER